MNLLSLVAGFVALVAFIVGLIVMDLLYAHRFGWVRKRHRLLNIPVKPITIDAFDWATLATGNSGWKEIEEAWLRKAQEVYTVFCEKQADYGPTNIAVGGEQGVTTRIGDKVSRLFELLGLTSRENSGEPANESVRDTWIDIADYGLIGMIVHDGDWPLVTPTQVWGKEAAFEILLEMIKDDEQLAEILMSQLVETKLAQLIAEDVGGQVVND